jgi:hypothetical protein
MTQQVINVGAAANDRTGDTWRDAMVKSNDNFTELYGLHPSALIVISSKDDLPAPAAGVITLASNTKYLFAESVSLGTDRLVLGNNTVIAGVETILVTLSYDGTGDLFTWTNATISIHDVAINCPNGRMFNATNSGQVLRFTDVVVVSCDKVGIFSGSASPRFTFFTCVDVKTDGIDFGSSSIGNLLYGPGLTNLNGGTMLKLGTATFDSFTVDAADMELAAGTTAISGLAGSGNINAGGIGAILNSRFQGAGAILSGISVDDARWSSFGNDTLRDSRSDGLLSMQGNVTATTINTSGVFELVAGTWVVESVSQFTGTTGGRLTYDAPKDVRVPITLSCSVEPVSGTNKTISIAVAINGVAIPNSKRTSKTDAGNPVSITVPWQETLSQTDYVEAYVTNETDTTNILVSSAISRVN